ncbi:MAG: hypothetical protein RIT27_237 [Pseudomonadota bacterium]|jgi:hypothetical protein
MRIKSLWWAVFLVAGCAPAGGALKPVAAQNQQNLAAMARNVHLLLHIHETLLKAASDTLLFQQIAKTEAELIAVVGTPQLPLKSEKWEDAIEKSAKTFIGRKSKFTERFQYVKSSLARGLSSEEMQQLSAKEGWIFSALTNPNFTPQKAHETLKVLSELRRTNETGKDSIFYEEATRRLKVFDARLEYVENTIKAAETLLGALKQELLKELDRAFAHSQSFVNYAQAEIDPESALRHFASDSLNEIITALANKYVENPVIRKAAVSLLMKGSDTLTNNL